MKDIITDLLWKEMKKVIPEKRGGVGRPEFDNRKAVNGILFILKTGAQWDALPEKYGCRSTVHGKFMKWCAMGIFKKIMSIARLYYLRRNKGNIWYAFDTRSAKAPFANFSGKNPTDRGKRGIKHSILVDRKGAPLFASVGPANQYDSKTFIPVVKNLRKSKKTRIIAGDSAFDVQELRAYCKEKNIALIASPNPRRKKDKHTFNVPHRYVAEQNFGCLVWFRNIKICWNKTIQSATAFLELACSLRLFKMAGIS